MIGVIALLLAILAPALAGAREAARDAKCSSNLRQCVIAVSAYADDYNGVGPAIGVPWGQIPNWALVVQDSAGVQGNGAAELYHADSSLVCPSADAFYAPRMTRTYAMNTTGHARDPEDPELANDPDSFDDPSRPAHLRLYLAPRPSDTPLLLDAAVAFIPDGAPPPTRASSVIDFRQLDHVEKRIGRFHGPVRGLSERNGFNAAAFDGSVRQWDEVLEHWLTPLP